MFDELFGPSAEKLQEANTAHAINFTTLVILLIDKGLVTEDEIKAARSQAVHLVDQDMTKKRHEAEEEFDRKYPGLRKFFGTLGKADARS